MQKKKLCAIAALLVCGALVGVGFALTFLGSVNIGINIGEHASATITFNGQPATGETLNLTWPSTVSYPDIVTYFFEVTNTGNTNIQVYGTTLAADSLVVTWNWDVSPQTAVPGGIINGNLTITIPENALVGPHTVTVKFEYSAI